MKPAFRPVPITMMDFLAVLLAGMVWVLVLSHTWLMAVGINAPVFLSPVESWGLVLDSVSTATSTVGLVTMMVLGSLLVGYLLQPIGVRLATIVTRGLVRHRMGVPKNPKMRMVFPYTDQHKEHDYFKKIVAVLNECIGCDVMELPGYQPFSAAKRFLRLSAPTLWEEGERAEAEVRMLASLLLASLYNLILCLVAGIAGVFHLMSGFDGVSYAVWISVSLILVYLLAQGFVIARDRELRYTYVNLLIAAGFQHRRNADSEIKDE